MATKHDRSLMPQSKRLDPFGKSRCMRAKNLSRSEQLAKAAADTIAKDGISPASFESFILRRITRAEMATLGGASCRCRCRGWENILVMTRAGDHKSDMSAELSDQVQDTTFSGFCVLGLVKCGTVRASADPPPLRAGIRRNGLVANCILEPGCCVQNNGNVDRTHLWQGAKLMDCDYVSADDTFVDEMEITLGAESGGGRKVKVQAETTVVDACQRLGISKTSMNQGVLPDRVNLTMKLRMNIICSEASIASTATVANVYLSSHSFIDAATCVKNAVLLPHSKIIHASTVDSVFLQWNAKIVTSAVSSTLLMECAELGPNSSVSSVLLGPDSHLSHGECHHSLIGPNTNSHHQSLLISVLWPLGRGNVGYGGNVGSNHTGRLPDQEVAAGEGIFWGLGCAVKMPINLCEAPYSIIAAGVQLPPQRICMPFSLILSGKDGLNQILPGWILQSSPYTIARSESKFALRRKAKRHDWYTGWDIIRPSTVDMCIRAREQLLKAGHSQVLSFNQASRESTAKVFNSDESIPGLGDNYLTEKARQKGIRAYSDMIQRYALRGLLHKVEGIVERCHDSLRDKLSPIEICRRLDGILSSSRKDCGASILTGVNVDPMWPTLAWEEQKKDPNGPKADGHWQWDHQRCVLKLEMQSILGMSASYISTIKLVAKLLLCLVQLESDYANRVFKSKERDDLRGLKMMPGYEASHIMAERDLVCKRASEESGRVDNSVKSILATLELSPTDKDRSKL